MEKIGVVWKSRYFDETVDGTGAPKFVFNGLYWKDRETQDWSNTPSIF